MLSPLSPGKLQNASFSSKDLLELALIARAAYEDDYEQSGVSVEGWANITGELVSYGLSEEFLNLSQSIFYRETRFLFDFWKADAQATVLRSDTGKIAVGFRGTESPLTDSEDWLSVERHAEEFDPLIEAVRSYAAANGISDIWLTGHSLGAGVTEVIAHNNQDVTVISGGDFYELNFAALALASPLASYRNDDRVTNFGHQFDLVYSVNPNYGFGSNAAVENYVILDDNVWAVDLELADIGSQHDKNIIYPFTIFSLLSSEFYSSTDRDTKVIFNYTNEYEEVLEVSTGIFSDEPALILGRGDDYSAILPADRQNKPDRLPNIKGGEDLGPNDILIGGGANDTLEGFSGNDILRGDSVLLGDGGDDILAGGPGADVYLGTPGEMDGDTIIGLEIGDSIFLEGEVVAQEDVSFDATTITVDGTGGWLGLFEGDIHINANVPQGSSLEVKTGVGTDGKRGTWIEVVAQPKLYFTAYQQGIYEVFSPGRYSQIAENNVGSLNLTVDASGNLVTGFGTRTWNNDLTILDYPWTSSDYDYVPSVDVAIVDPTGIAPVRKERYLGEGYSIFYGIYGLEYDAGGYYAVGPGGNSISTRPGGYTYLTAGLPEYEVYNTDVPSVGTSVGVSYYAPAYIRDLAKSSTGLLYGLIGRDSYSTQSIVSVEKRQSEVADFSEPLVSGSVLLEESVEIFAIAFSSDDVLFGYGKDRTGSQRGIYEIDATSGDVIYVGDFLTGTLLRLATGQGDFVFTGSAAEFRTLLGAEIEPDDTEMSSAPEIPTVLAFNELSVAGFGGALAGRSGNTRLRGSSGNDILSDLDGHNELVGNEGDDDLETGDGNDVLSGGAGKDLIRSGAGDDFADGGADDDDIQAGDGNDIVLGADGNDVIDAGSGDDQVYSGAGGSDVVTLGAGKDQLIGTKGELIGDRVSDFTGEDEIVLSDLILSRTQIGVQSGSALLDLDEDRDGISEGRITLDGDFSGGDFMAVRDGSNTVVTFETFLPALQERQAVEPALVNGIINQNFLRGDGSSNFQIMLRDMGFAGYNNALGVYEVDDTGAILDPRILIANANADKSAQALITNIEDGHYLGFFLVQNAAVWASSLAGTDVLAFADAEGNAANLDDGNAIDLTVNGALVDEMVFHSIDAALNKDGIEHALSGVEPGGMAITVGFEDLTGGGDRDYEDVVFRVEVVEAQNALLA